LVRKVVHGCVALDDHEDVLPPLPAAVVTKVADMMIPSVSVVPTIENFASWKHYFLVESAGETLVVFKLETSMEVYKVKIGNNTLEKMQSICNRALFIGPYRCLSLDADKFPSIEANCIYFTSRMGSDFIDIYHLEDGQQGQVVIGNEDEPSVDLPTSFCNTFTAHPVSIITLLSLYTLNCQSSQASQVLEHEDRLLEQLKSGELSISDLLLQASMEDTDSESSDV
jgi:hypothetical protein